MSNQKTRVEVIKEHKTFLISKGMKGYIDGYLNHDTYGYPVAVVICNGIIDTVPFSHLKILNNE